MGATGLLRRERQGPSQLAIHLCDTNLKLGTYQVASHSAHLEWLDLDCISTWANALKISNLAFDCAVLIVGEIMSNRFREDLNLCCPNGHYYILKPRGH